MSDKDPTCPFDHLGPCNHVSKALIETVPSTVYEIVLSQEKREAISERLVYLRKRAAALDQQMKNLAKELGEVREDYLREYRLAQKLDAIDQFKHPYPENP